MGAGATAIPCDDEVPCMVGLCFLICYPKAGCCQKLGAIRGEGGGEGGEAVVPCGCFGCRCTSPTTCIKQQGQCCCMAGATAIPCDDEVPCMVGLCFLICYPKAGCCQKLGAI